MALFLMNSGSYTGSGIAGQVISTDFPGDAFGIVIPQLVIIVNPDDVSNITQHAWKWTSLTDSVIGFQSKVTTGITALSAGSFTVGAHAAVNTTGNVHRWVAFADVNELGDPAQDVLATGAYTGNGVDNTQITVPFAPDFVSVRRQINNAEDAWAHFLFTAAGGADDTICKTRPSDEAIQTDQIKTLNSTGFTVGTTGSVNLNGAAYTWLALRRKTGFIGMGSYEGNAVDGRTITVGFQPSAVLLQGVGNISGAVGPLFRCSPGYSGDECSYLSDSTNDNIGGGGIWADGIESFVSTGFTVGDGVGLGGAANGYGSFANANGVAPREFYVYMALLSELLPATAAIDLPGGGGIYMLPESPYTFYKSQVALSERLRSLRLR